LDGSHNLDKRAIGNPRGIDSMTKPKKAKSLAIRKSSFKDMFTRQAVVLAAVVVAAVVGSIPSVATLEFVGTAVVVTIILDAAIFMAESLFRKQG